MGGSSGGSDWRRVIRMPEPVDPDRRESPRRPVVKIKMPWAEAMEEGVIVRRDLLSIPAVGAGSNKKEVC